MLSVVRRIVFGKSDSSYSSFLGSDENAAAVQYRDDVSVPGMSPAMFRDGRRGGRME